MARDTRSDDEKRYDPTPIEFETDERGDKKPVRGQYYFQHAVISNYAGYDLLAKDYYDENRNGPLREELYLGLTKNYDNRGNYDNSDGELIFVSDNPRIWGLLAGDGYTVSQQRLIDENDFRESDYEEFYRLNYEGGRLQSLPRKCEVRFCAEHGAGPDSGVPFRYPDWRREDPETVRADREERKVADAREEVRDYLGLEAEDPDTLLVYKSKVGRDGEYRVYGDRAAIAAALIGCPVEKRDLGFGISPLTARIREEDLAGALGAFHPLYRVRVVADGRTVAVIPGADEPFLSHAAKEGAPHEDGLDEDGYDDEPDGKDDGEDAGKDGEDAGKDGKDGGNDGKDGEGGHRGDRTMLRVRGETALIMRRMGIDVYDEGDLSPVSSRDVDPDASYAIEKSRWDAFTASTDGKEYMYVLKNLEDAVTDWLAALGAGEDVLDVLRGDAEDSAAVVGGVVPERVSAFQTQELLKIFASRIAEDGSALIAAEREIASRVADERVRAAGLALADGAEAEAFAREELSALGFSEGLEYGLTDEERESAAGLLKVPYGERMASSRPGTYEDYLSGPLGEALFRLSASGDPRDRRAEVKERVAASYASYMDGLEPAGTQTEEALRAYGIVTMTALRDAVEDNLLSDGAYRALSDEDDPLRGMFDEYTEKDYPYMASGEEAASFAEGYCARFHPETADRAPAFADDACPEYSLSRAEAFEKGETREFERSLSADMRCARDIGDALKDGLPRPGAVAEICARYGRDRVDAVIMRNIGGMGWDERLPADETARARALAPVGASPDPAVFEADAEALNVFLKTFEGLSEERYGGTFSRALPEEVAAAGGAFASLLTEFETDENPFEDAGAEEETAAEETAAPGEELVFIDPIPDRTLPAGTLVVSVEEETAEEETAEDTAAEEIVFSDPVPAGTLAAVSEEEEAAEDTAAEDTAAAEAPAGEQDAGKRPVPPAGAEKPAGGESAESGAGGKTRWCVAYVPEQAVRGVNERTFTLDMPSTGPYAGYSTVLSTKFLREPFAEKKAELGFSALTVCLPAKDDFEVRFTSPGRETVTLTPAQTRAALAGRTPEDYAVPEASETVFAVPAAALAREGDGYVDIRMPEGYRKGYLARLRSSWVDRDIRADEGMLEIRMPVSASVSLYARKKEFGSVSVSAKALAMRLRGASPEDFDYPEDFVPEGSGLNSKELHDGLRRYEEEHSAPAPADERVCAVFPAAAAAMDYGDEHVFAMPSGPLRGYFACVKDEAVERRPDGSFSVSMDGDEPVVLVDIVGNRETEVDAGYVAASLEGKTEKDWEGGYAPERGDDLYLRDDLRSVPEAMRERPNWVGVRVVPGKDGGRYRKLLISPVDGMYARSDAPSTWAPFSEALAFARANGCDALAYALDGKDGVCCLDLDGCRGEDGEYTEAAKTVMDATRGTYSEKSVSGTGIHVFGRTERFTDRRAFSKDGSMELYAKSHFITMTGEPVRDGSEELLSFDEGPAAEIIDGGFARRADARKYEPGSGADGVSRMSDREVLEKAFRSRDGETFRALYEGQDIKNNPSNSDMALMTRLAFWCGGDKEQMLRIFETSGLYRPDKSPEYYEYTAIKAMRCNTDRYGDGKPRAAAAQKTAGKEDGRCPEKSV